MSDPWIEGFPPENIRPSANPRVYTPQWNLPIVAIALGNRLWTRYLHYDDAVGRRVPCTLGEDCTYCPDPTREPTGYLPAYCPHSRKLCILQLSKHALSMLKAIVASRPDLRGALLKTERADRRPCARMLCSLAGSVDPAGLPADFDPRLSLESMWGWSLRGVAAGPIREEGDDAKPKARKRRA